MKTEQLISVLASNTQCAAPIAPRLSGLAGLALICAGLSVLTVLGIRADLVQAISSPTTLMKWLLPLAVALPAILVIPSMWQPQTRHMRLLLLSALVAAGAFVWLVSSAMATPAPDLWATWRGNSRVICLTSIVSISLLPLAAAMYVLRDGASPAPTHCGACVGLAIGGLSTAIYALHCTEDAPLFFLTWYSLAILIVTAIGAICGARFLRW